MEIATILSLVEFAIDNEPKVATALKNILSKPNPTPADWQAERQAWVADTYEKLVLDSQLPVQGPDPQPPA